MTGTKTRQPTKARLKSIAPPALLNLWRKGRYWMIARRGQSPEEIFSSIYKSNTWGGDKGVFYSGEGTRDPAVAEPYVAALRSWLLSVNAPARTVVDLGCGDFMIGKRITDLCGRYVGVDVVPALVEHNQRNFGTSNITFSHLDVTRDPLPDGDICIIRQVLQHLSNAQISAILAKLDKYALVLVSEHHPADSALIRPNIDKPTDSGSRSAIGSGVFLGQPPFEMVDAKPGVLPELPLEGGFLRTYLIEREELAAKRRTA